MHSIDSLIVGIASLLLCRLGLLLLPGPAWLCALACNMTKPLAVVALKPLSTRLGASVYGTNIHRCTAAQWSARRRGIVIGTEVPGQRCRVY